MKTQVVLLLATLALTALTFIDAPYPDELKLQHAPTLGFLLVLAATIWWYPLSLSSFVCVTVFLWLHILGARWIYSFVPYDEWTTAIAGVSLSDHFGWQRNHYDRLVHFASGLLFVPPAAELLQRLGGMRPLGAAVVAVAVVLAGGAIYEILEWQIATLFSPAQAEAYNGQQGDVWDPQKDMALAWLGGVVGAALVFRQRYGEQDPRVSA